MLTNIGARLRRWRRRLSRAEWETNRLSLKRSEAPSHSPGLLLVQIDGLSRQQFERAMEAGRLPFLRRLHEREGCRLHTFYSGQPATTPAVQAELYYGVRAAVPAFSFLDARADAIGVMMHPDWAKRIEADLAAKHEGLLKDGSSWSNIYTGGATQEESHFCGASIGPGDMWATGKIRNIFLFAFLHFPSFLRLVALLPVELFISLRDAFYGVRRGQSPGREFLFILARVFICVGLREMVTLGAKIDLARGLPVIHVNYLGYDEQSHRRGPGSLFAHWTLRGIDRSVRDLHRAARRSDGRDYEVVIFSDHGQIRTRPFAQSCPGGLEGLLRRHWPGLSDADRTSSATHRDQSRLRHAPRLRPRRDAARAPDRSRLTPFEQTEFAVACMGPVGHLYFKKPLSDTDEARLIRDLLDGGVPGILQRRASDDAVLWHTSDQAPRYLPEESDLLRGPKELIPVLARDLADLARQPCAGNLVCLGWHPSRPSVSFTDENGAHCGPSPDETQGLLLLPPAFENLLHQPVVRPSQLREAALIHLGRRERPAHRRRTRAAPTHLRVVTYNVHYCKGLDGRFAPDRIARILRALDPDLIALQELDCGRPRSRGDDQLAVLAEELGLHQLFCPSIVNGEERYGHGLLATRPLSLVSQARLPTGGVPVIEPRDGLHATLTVGDREISVVTTHLGLAYAERAAQIDRLLQNDFLGGIPADRPALFLGDLNLAPGGKLYRRLVSRWQRASGDTVFRDVQAHAPNHVAIKTFPSFMPVRQLDHIFVTPQFKIQRVHSPANLLTRRASDHLPLVADLELDA
jgi:endonuclease/exonuclease/phosphatase family metal-dependent hydrolase